MNNFSYGDLQFGQRINQALQEYNSIEQKLNKANGNFYPILKNNYLYKTPSRYSHKLARKSPFSSKNGGNNFNPLTLHRNSQNRNILNSRKINNTTFIGNNDILEEFKNTLEKSQIIKEDLLKMNSNFKLTNKNRQKNYLLKRKLNLSFKASPLIKSDDNITDLESSILSNGGYIKNYIPKRKVEEKQLKTDKYIKKSKQKNLKDKEKEKEKLESEGKIIINDYNEIKKENRILEIEIENYKKLANQISKIYDNNYENGFDNRYSRKTINELEESLHQNNQNNCKIIDSILKIQKSNDDLTSKIKILSNQVNKNFKKIEKRNRKNAEIQILNEENEQKVINLQEEKISLQDELEKKKIMLLNLKYKEKNLNLLNESNKKALNDKEEHIIKLKNSINQYHKYNKNIYQNKMLNNINDNIMIYNDKINNLKTQINNLISKKEKILLFNNELQIKLLNFIPNDSMNNNENQLFSKLNALRDENIQKNNYLKEKDNQIEILKREMDSFAFQLKNNNEFDYLQKKHTDNYFNDINQPININQNNINEEIKRNLELNYQKNYEIEEFYKKYKQTVFDKDKIINNLELLSKGQPNDLPNNLNINSINELTLGEEEINFDEMNINTNEENNYLNINEENDEMDHQMPLLENKIENIYSNGNQKDSDLNYGINNNEYLNYGLPENFQNLGLQSDKNYIYNFGENNLKNANNSLNENNEEIEGQNNGDQEYFNNNNEIKELEDDQEVLYNQNLNNMEDLNKDEQEYFDENQLNQNDENINNNEIYGNEYENNNEEMNNNLENLNVNDADINELDENQVQLNDEDQYLENQEEEQQFIDEGEGHNDEEIANNDENLVYNNSEEEGDENQNVEEYEEEKNGEMEGENENGNEDNVLNDEGEQFDNQNVDNNINEIDMEQNNNQNEDHDEKEQEQDIEQINDPNLDENNEKQN